MKKKILINGPYPPLFSYGGPTRSIEGLFETLMEDFTCIVISPKKQLNSNNEVDIKNKEKKVIYTNYEFFEILKKFNKFEVLWLNSFFEFKTIFFVYLSLFFKKKVIISPRGQFAIEAIISSNPKLKFFFIKLIKPIHSQIIFHSTSGDEKNNILKFYHKSEIVEIPNISKAKFYENKSTEKRYLFFSRIHKKKGLDIILKYLKENSLNIKLDICGFIEDQKYWEYCKTLMYNRPNIKYIGEIGDGNISRLREKYMFFIFPTLNENFGHVIFELISEGIIPILSKGTTPFEDVTSKFIDLNFNLESSVDFKISIEKSLSMDKGQIKVLRKNLKEIYSKFKIQETVHKKDYINFINQI